MKRLLFLATGIFCFTMLSAQTPTTTEKSGPPDISKIALRENSRDQKMLLRDNRHRKLVLQRRQFIMKRNQMMLQRKMQMQKKRQQLKQNKLRQKRLQQQMIERRKRMNR